MAAVNIDINTASPSRRSPFRPRRFLRIMSLPLSVALLSLTCQAQDHSTESQVKAAYVYNFGKFVTWPADSTFNPQLFQICVLGKDPFGAILDTTVNGESIDHKKIEIRRLAKIQDAPGCHVLFVSSSEEARLPAILIEAQRLRLLTVSDIPHFAERGGTIGLVTQEDRVRFEVNRSAAEQTHLVLSSELLKVAIRVIQNHKGS